MMGLIRFLPPPPHLSKYIQGCPKKLTPFVLYALISSNIDRFSNLFHCLNQQNICNNTVTKEKSNHTSSVLLHYLVKCQCLKSYN